MAQKSEFTVAGAREYNTSGNVRWILPHARRYPLYVSAMFIFKALSVIAYSVFPVYIAWAADAILNRGQDAARTILIAGLWVLGSQVASGVFGLVGSLASETVAQRLENDAREELYRSLLGKSQTYHDRQRVGDIMSRATEDVRHVNYIVNPGTSLLYETGTQLIVPFVMIAFLEWRLLLVPFIYLFFYAWTLRDYTRRMEPVAGAQRWAFGKMSAGLEETISGIETVKSTAQEPFERTKFQDNARAFREQFVRQGRVEAGYIPPLVFGVTYGLIIVHAMWLYQQGVITIPDIIAVVGIYSLLWFPTFASIWTFSIMQLGFASAKRILEVINAETELDENAGGHSAPIEGEIVFEGVSFGYEGTDFGVAELDFKVSPGQTIAIVGETGSGKTTLTQLVNRTYDASKGTILIDGVDVREWDLDALRSQISKIEQDVFLFSRSIAENIAFGRPDATKEKIEQAAKEAQAHDFIMSFDKGYETVIGERGVTLSGGQRQRIALARAFLSNPRILILDDSTSAIDSATEDEIQKAIHRARQGRTTLLITHRLSQIRWADVIIVMQKGKVAAMGGHDELLRRSALYRRIFARYDVALPPLEAAAD